MPLGRGDGVKSGGGEGVEEVFFLPAVPFTTPTHRYFVLPQVLLASRDQDGDSTIDNYDLTEK